MNSQVQNQKAQSTLLYQFWETEANKVYTPPTLIQKYTCTNFIRNKILTFYVDSLTYKNQRKLSELNKEYIHYFLHSFMCCLWSILQNTKQYYTYINDRLIDCCENNNCQVQHYDFKEILSFAVSCSLELFHTRKYFQFPFLRWIALNSYIYGQYYLNLEG